MRIVSQKVKLLACCLVAHAMICAPLVAQTSPARAWPHPIQARIKDGTNKDLFVMTLGDVDTPLADGVFDPAADELRLKDGTVIKGYYKDRLRVRYFAPIDKSHFPLPPAGWCSWYYYYQEINETEVRRNAEWIARNLKDYGAQYVQIDDGWQGAGRGQSDNRDWTKVNAARFPSGLDGLAAYIKELGLKPGIWLAPHGQSNEQVVKSHPRVFLLKEDGSSASSTWEGRYLVDPSTPEAREYLKDLFRTLKRWGYEYFKIDGQPIVVREYRTKRAFMKDQTEDPVALYRKTLASIRSAIGPDSYLLGCWGIPLEGIGIMNGSRTGTDIVAAWNGFKYALRATMQYYFLHNIAWYTDPDVFVVRPPLPLEQARAWATLQGLTGQALLTSDRLMDLPEERVELLRRIYPAVDIRPLDLFPAERDKRIFDLKIKHLDRQYDVVGIFNYDEDRPSLVYLNWQELGLPANRPVHIFDFWNREYLGAWEHGMTIELNPASCRVLTLLPDEDRIQLISTSRHITQGWVDLLDQRYDPATHSYSGRSRVIKDDPYELRFVFPRGKNFAIKKAIARTEAGELPVKIDNHQGWATIEFAAPRTTEVRWEVAFEPAEFYRYPVREPSNPWIERVSLDGVDLRWNPPYQGVAGYVVALNGRPLGFTPTNVFTLRNLDPDAAYTAEIRAVWYDGTLSEKGARVEFSLRQLLPQELPLSALTPLRLTSGWQQPERDRTFLGTRLSLDGQSHATGIGMPTDSEIEFGIAGPYTTFSALVGIDDSYRSNDPRSVEFTVSGDGKELWQGVVKKGDRPLPVKVNISGVRRLSLRVRRVGGDGGRVPADWADAKLVR
ncbi:NPCBM/NEW2 domain-containing protein [Pyrinomonas methylaliphatogenes]|uniref:Alpha-galactosidase n=1 Tax=Pyrinomonas methylaliphatogenes TaxID=454194 RepID=A0A0B6WUT9_9BACT|nr:NPCBM/NEW2 domain-containing protein [Pyrinomonas methylaliphatogenes]CDM65028.1 alpha-galactosidase [Pyrinomonas methylaliphatogenes]